MKICVTCVYWTLLFISVASSALLFIIVACENAQSNYYSPVGKNETSERYINDTLNSLGIDLEKVDVPVSELRDPRKLDVDYGDRYYGETVDDEPDTFKATNVDETKKKEKPYNNPDILTESLTQQPNLSQGISGDDQASILTFMDTTAADLQNLAEPKLKSEFPRARMFAKNSSILTKINNDERKTKEEKIPLSTPIPLSSIDDEITETPNETSSLEKESLLLFNSVADEALDEVVIVRAEQMPITTDRTEYKSGDKIDNTFPDEMPQVVEGFTTAPELNDVEAKARLVGSNRDETASVVLGDGIVTIGSSNPHEDIPSFNEWTQKRLEEAEKKKSHPNASIQNSGATTRGVGGMKKVRSKNYASPDCGAKVVAANPEARSARSVLVTTRDEYMLNTCTSRIWFVVELCEAIQAKKIELANFELFSSSPKDFSVYISDRFPTRDWSPVGQFTAKDIKDVQNFVLQPQLFGKFIKVELQSHYGSEHFCPVSLFRAYGTSEFEVLETETENQVARETYANMEDEDDSDEEEEDLDVQHGEPPRNLFGSARDAVLSIMKKAAEVLVKSSDLTGNNITNIQESIDSDDILENSFVSCTTPRYTILCDNCSDEKFAKIFQLVSCREQQLNQLLKIDLVNKTLRQSGLCMLYGVRVERFAKREAEIESKTEEEERKFKSEDRYNMMRNFEFITSILKPEYIAALCNVLAIKERKMVMNTSHEIPFIGRDVISEDTQSKGKEEQANDLSKSFQHTAATDTTNMDTSRDSKQSPQQLSSEGHNKSVSSPDENASNSESVLSQSSPPKTTNKEESESEFSVPVVESNKNNVEETIEPESSTITPISTNAGKHSTTEEPSVTSGMSIETSSQSSAPVPLPITSTETNEMPNEDTLPDIESIELPGIQSKLEKIERGDQEVKQGQLDHIDQDVKLHPQDSLAFDNILSDLKDLEGEAGHIQNGGTVNPSTMQSATNTAPQKASVFLRLSNRIKALERNMSLSGQYLEELSRRYKKQVEEMQKSFERTVSAMNEETKKRDERESKRSEEIAILKDEIASLSMSLNNLLYDRDSWRGKIYAIGQHLLLICSEVFVIYLILLYCRESNSKRSNVNQIESSEKDVKRRKSAENFSSHMKKMKKRRPSEIASNIAGTYGELLINEKFHETKKEKKKKRKRATALVANEPFVNKDSEKHLIAQCKSVYDVGHEQEDTPKIASSLEAVHVGFQRENTTKLKATLQEPIDWFNDTESILPLTFSCEDNVDTESARSTICVEDQRETNVSSPEPITCTDQSTMDLSGYILNSKSICNTLKGTRLRVTSSFMKTALSTRRKRKSYTNEMYAEDNRNVEDLDERTALENLTSSEFSADSSSLYIDHDTNTNGILTGQSDESRSSSIISMSKRKEKKSGSTGFRKMVRKFF